MPQAGSLKQADPFIFKFDAMSLGRLVVSGMFSSGFDPAARESSPLREERWPTRRGCEASNEPDRGARLNVILTEFSETRVRGFVQTVNLTGQAEAL